MNRFYRITFFSLLLGMATACNLQCERIPKAIFEAAGTIEQQVLYLEDQAATKITLKITPQNEVTEKEEVLFKIADWSLPEGLFGKLLDSDGNTRLLGCF